MRTRDLLMGVGLAAGATAVAIWSGTGAGREADREAFRSLNNEASEGAALFCFKITELGSIAASAGAAAVIALCGRPRAAVRAVSAAGFTWLACQGIKRVTNRPRPYHEVPEGSRLLIREPRAMSFPSSHPAVLTTFTRVAAREIGLGPIPVGALTAVDGAVGLSRVVLGVHWPSDVVGGLLFGRAVARLWPSRRS